jgi:hypothetical protein
MMVLLIRRSSVFRNALSSGEQLLVGGELSGASCSPMRARSPELTFKKQPLAKQPDKMKK